MPVMHISSKGYVYRNVDMDVKFTDIEVSDDVYTLDVVAVSKDLTKIEDPAMAEGPDWFTTDVTDNFFEPGHFKI